MAADDTPPIELTVDDLEEPTDPRPFGEAGNETTKRRCANCGTEIDHDDQAFRAGANAILGAVFRRLVRAGEPRASALEIIRALEQDAGTEVV